MHSALGRRPGECRRGRNRGRGYLWTIAGVGAAGATGKFVQSMLYGMKPWDASTYGAAALALWLVAIGAAWIPARRAARVDPMVALRYE